MVLQTSGTAQPADDAREVRVGHWVRLARRLPAVRVEKVVAVREALRRNRYDDEHILEETIKRLANEVGVLLRRDAPVP